jgi:hypothetical protein
VIYTESKTNPDQKGAMNELFSLVTDGNGSSVSNTPRLSSPSEINPLG